MHGDHGFGGLSFATQSAVISAIYDFVGILVRGVVAFLSILS
jgi:hypothetical protein